MQVVEIGRAVGPVAAEIGDGKQSAHRPRRFAPLRQSRVAWRAVVIIGTDNQAQARKLRPQRLRHQQQISGIESHGHRTARGLMDARPRRIAFGDT